MHPTYGFRVCRRLFLFRFLSFLERTPTKCIHVAHRRPWSVSDLEIGMRQNVQPQVELRRSLLRFESCQSHLTTHLPIRGLNFQHSLVTVKLFEKQPTRRRRRANLVRTVIHLMGIPLVVEYVRAAAIRIFAFMLFGGRQFDFDDRPWGLQDDENVDDLDEIREMMEREAQRSQSENVSPLPIICFFSAELPSQRPSKRATLALLFVSEAPFDSIPKSIGSSDILPHSSL